MQIKKSTYNQLKTYIITQYKSAREALVQSYWNIGKRIVEVEQGGKEHAGYGDELLRRLSVDLTEELGRGFSVRNLEKMRKFYLMNMKSPTSAIFDWSKHVELFSLKDETKLKEIQQRVVDENLPVRKIRELVRRENKTAEKHAPKKPTPKKPSKLRYIKRDLRILSLCKEANLPANTAKVDCGFHFYRIVKKSELKNVKLGKMSYTYPARINSIVDGDTIRADIELGLGAEVMQILRLRQINAPEMKSPEGKRAKQVLIKLLKDAQKIVVRTYSTDMYGRYLADIFFLPGCGDPKKILKEGYYLSQKLLDEGVAEKM